METNKPRFYKVFHTTKDGDNLITGEFLTKETAEIFARNALDKSGRYIYVVPIVEITEFLNPYRYEGELHLLDKYDDKGKWKGE